MEHNARYKHSLGTNFDLLAVVSLKTNKNRAVCFDFSTSHPFHTWQRELSVTSNLLLDV